MSTQDEWDSEGFSRSVDLARKQVEDVAYFIVSAKKRSDWHSHRPGIELVFYMALIDYESKVLIQRLMDSREDRFVWEKYLALHLHEVLDRVPAAIGATIREMRDTETASRANVELYELAARKLRTDFKPIRQDADFMKALDLIRNSVAAHHVEKKTSTMDPSIYWMLTSATQRRNGGSPMSSQIMEHSVTATTAIQDFAHAVTGVTNA